MEPSSAEVAKTLGITEQKVDQISSISKDPYSYNTPFNGSKNSSSLGDLLDNSKVVQPEDRASMLHTKRVISISMSLLLSAREERVVRYRSGLSDDGLGSYTLEKIGAKLNVTRERVRQIEAKAYRKLIDSNFYDYNLNIENKTLK